VRLFITGANGWIGSALVPQLIEGGHQVIGLARSEASAKAVAAAGAEVIRGTLDDRDVLRSAAAASDGVIHLAFKHDVAFSGDFQGAADTDRRAVEIVCEALAGSDRPFVLASGVIGVAPGRIATERDVPDTSGGGLHTRQATAQRTVDLASSHVRTSVVRLPPTVHGDGDHGFMAHLVATARQKGVSGYIGDGTNRWPAVHVRDAATVFRLAAENAPAGSVLHAIADEGVPMRTIAETIGARLNLPVVSVAPDEAGAHFGWLGAFLGLDAAASSAVTRELLGWQPTQPGLIDDLSEGHYFRG
jgi:nucleoside-diphosphate-sugar epimerase